MKVDRIKIEKKKSKTYALMIMNNFSLYFGMDYFSYINSTEGVFLAWQVTKREGKSGWKNWKWRSSKDVFMNGAYFVQSGYGSIAPPYFRTQRFPVAPGSMVPALTSDAGPLRCFVGKACGYKY